MSRRSATISAALLLIVGAGLAGCSGAGSDGRSTRHAAATTTTIATTTTTTTTTTTAPPVPLPEVVTNGSRDRPLIALTFDSNMTDAMLRELDTGKVASFANLDAIGELEQMQVPATMLLAGKWIERYPDVTRRLAANPLVELGSHSYSHRAFHLPCYGLGGLPVAEMAADVEQSEKVLRQYTEHPTNYFRFPGGCYDDTALQAIRPAGVQVIQYDLPGGDAFGTSRQAIVDNVLRNAQNGSIVVMHITGGNTAPLTAQALPAIVDGLRRRGFTLVKLSELLGQGL